MKTRDIAAVAWSLRAASLARLDSLTDVELETPALPGWTVADVYRHLAASDRGSVLGSTLLGLRGSEDVESFETSNDATLTRLRAAPRDVLRRELEVWGRRLTRLIRWAPAPLAGIRVPIVFGRVPLWWVACLRPYDEWVHQHDVAVALGERAPEMDLPTRRLVALFLLEGIASTTLPQIDDGHGVVEVRFVDVAGVVSRYDLGRGEAGGELSATPDATVEVDVPGLTLVASRRVTCDDLGDRLVVTGDRDTADALLQVIWIV